MKKKLYLVSLDKKFRYVLFAGDIKMLSRISSNNVENCVNTELNNIHKWLCTNKLSIDLLKTIYQRLIYFENCYSQSKVNSCAGFPGVYVDNKLSWNKHIDYVSIKLHTFSFQISHVLI